MSRILYFGCIGASGHYLFRPSSTGYAAVKCYNDAGTGWRDYELDGSYPPAKRRARPDDRPPPYVEREAAQGAAALHHIEKDGVDWTILAFWDRSVDQRGGSSSTFLLEGTFDYPTAVETAKAAFPRVWERFTFHVHLFQGEL